MDAVLRERALVLAAQSGDSVALGELCEMHTGFLMRAARKIHCRHADSDDLVQVGKMRLMEIATRHFDPSTGVRFLTYAAKCAIQAMRRYAALASLDSISLDHNPATGERIDVSDESLDPAEEAGQRERLRQLHQVLATLPCRELEVCLMVMKGDTYADIGRTLVLSRERVRQIHESAKSRIAAGLQRTGK